MERSRCEACLQTILSGKRSLILVCPPLPSPATPPLGLEGRWSPCSRPLPLADKRARLFSQQKSAITQRDPGTPSSTSVLRPSPHSVEEEDSHLASLSTGDIVSPLSPQRKQQRKAVVATPVRIREAERGRACKCPARSGHSEEPEAASSHSRDAETRPGPPSPGLTPARPRALEGPVSVDLLSCGKDKHCPRLGILPAPVSMTQQNLLLFTQQRRECLLQFRVTTERLLCFQCGICLCCLSGRSLGALGRLSARGRGLPQGDQRPSRPRGGVAGEGGGGHTRIRDLFPHRWFANKPRTGIFPQPQTGLFSNRCQAMRFLSGFSCWVLAKSTQKIQLL